MLRLSFHVMILCLRYQPSTRCSEAVLVGSWFLILERRLARDQGHVREPLVDNTQNGVYHTLYGYEQN